VTVLAALAAVSGLFYGTGLRTGRLDPAGTLAFGLWAAVVIFLAVGLYAA
jgi:hypothetical protein